MTEPRPASPGKRLRLPDGPLASCLQEAFASILAYAQLQAGLASVESFEKPVHEFRKSVRRGRSVVKLLRGLMPKSAYRSLNGALRDAVARTSVLRDVDVLLGHVEALPDEPELGPIKVALRAHLVARQAELRADETGSALAEGVERLKPLHSAFRAAIPEALLEDDLRGALGESYRRARAALGGAMREAVEGRGDESLHDFRKRTKELRYQLELLRPRASSSEPLQALADLAERLGEVTDLVVLRDYAAAHRAELEADPGLLLERLGGEAAALKEQVLGDAAPLFAEKPRAFARGLLSA